LSTVLPASINVISPRYSWSFVTNFRGELYNAKVYSFVEANIFYPHLAIRDLGDKSVTSRKCRTRLLFHARELTHARHILHSRCALRDAKRARLSNFGAHDCARHARKLSPHRYRSISLRRTRKCPPRGSPLVTPAPSCCPLLKPRISNHQFEMPVLICGESNFPTEWHLVRFPRAMKTRTEISSNVILKLTVNSRRFPQSLDP